MNSDATPLVRPLKGKILVDIVDQGSAIINGIITLSDDFTERGIRPREAVVLAIGPEVDEEIRVGSRVLIPHGDWTRKFRIPLSDGTSKWAWMTLSEKIMMVIER